MKITDLKVFIVGNPPPGWGGRYFTFIKLTTDNGITGIGECYCATFGPKAMTAMIEDTYGRYVEGMDPFHIESLWRKVYGSGYSMRPDEPPQQQKWQKQLSTYLNHHCIIPKRSCPVGNLSWINGKTAKAN